MTGPPALVVRGLAHAYDGVPVLRDVSIDVAPGEVVAVLGSSGAGKTTLFRSVTRLVDPDAGEIIACGRPLHGARGRALQDARRDVAVIFQQFNLVRRLTAYENVLAGRLGHVPTWRALARRFDAADRGRAHSALARVGLGGLAHQRADRLSGGQQQRVAIARALAQESRLILADEPVASLDPESAETVLGTLREVAAADGIGVLVSLHQVGYATAFADRVIGLRAGRMVLDVPACALTDAHRAAVYGLA